MRCAGNGVPMFLLIRSDESSKGGNLVAFCAELLLEHPELCPDIPVAGSDSSEVFLDSLCRFDFLWCCLSVAAVGDGPASAAFYPSCSAYHQTRVMLALRKVESEPQVRAEIFGDIADRQIADAIITVIEMAHSQSWNYGGWWDSVRDLPPNGWTTKNATPGDLIRA